MCDPNRTPAVTLIALLLIHHWLSNSGVRHKPGSKRSIEPSPRDSDTGIQTDLWLFALCQMISSMQCVFEVNGVGTQWWTNWNNIKSIKCRWLKTNPLRSLAAFPEVRSSKGVSKHPWLNRLTEHMLKLLFRMSLYIALLYSLTHTSLSLDKIL